MTKTFIDNQGTFEIKVPFTWKHSLSDGKPHTFQEYEVWKSDAFQLSINPIKDQEYRERFNAQLKQLKTVDAGDITCYAYPEAIDKEFTVKAWTLLLNDKRILFTFTIPNLVDPELDSRTIEDKEKIALECISSFRLIEDVERGSKLNFYRFDMFLQGVGSTSLILSKAIENKAFIEATSLLASQIDALLRTGIILKNQLVNNNSEIELEWIYQGLNDKKKSEKDVYKKAKELAIINDAVFNELYVLYDDRNRVIHRFIISEITLAEVEEIAYRYYQMREKVNAIIFDLEAEQIRLNVGMSRKDDGKDSTDHLDYIKGKIGKQNYFEDKT